MRVAIYCRVSDDKLKDDGERRQDIERQVQRLLIAVSDWIALHKEFEFDPSKDIYKDDAVTAFKEDYNSRPAFVKMLREIDANRIHKVYVESLDRWSRRVVDGLTTLDRVSIKANCTITSIQEGEVEVTTPQGWFKTAVSFVLAEWASRDKQDKVKSGIERRRNDLRRICKACGIIHMGRHPITCLCYKCLEKHPERKGRVEFDSNKPLKDADQ